MPQVYVQRRFRPQPASERQLLAQIEPMLLEQGQFIPSNGSVLRARVTRFPARLIGNQSERRRLRPLKQRPECLCEQGANRPGNRAATTGHANRRLCATQLHGPRRYGHRPLCHDHQAWHGRWRNLQNAA
jgi:hypothetical protein